MAFKHLDFGVWVLATEAAYKCRPFCHCEEHSDEAIAVGLLRMEIATHLSGARNDKKEEARNDTPLSLRVPIYRDEAIPE